MVEQNVIGKFRDFLMSLSANEMSDVCVLISAMRGPDVQGKDVDSIKDATTCRLRQAVLEDEFNSEKHEYFGKPGTFWYVTPMGVTILHSIEPAYTRKEVEDSCGSHFVQHYYSAITILERLGIPIVAFKEDKLVE